MDVAVVERWPLGRMSDTGVLALADTSASSLDEANRPCYELIRCLEHGILNQRRQNLANPLHSLCRLKFKFFFIDWLLQAFAFQLQCRCTVSWRWWTSQLTVRVLVSSHPLTSVLGINSTYLRNHHQVTSDYYHDNDGPHTWSYWLPWHHRPCAPDFKAHASRRSAMCEATLAILLQVFHIGARRHCVTAGWTI